MSLQIVVGKTRHEPQWGTYTVRRCVIPKHTHFQYELIFSTAFSRTSDSMTIIKYWNQFFHGHFRLTENRVYVEHPVEIFNFFPCYNNLVACFQQFHD